MNGCGYQKWYEHGDGEMFDLTNAASGGLFDSDHNGNVYTSLLNSWLFQKWRLQGDLLQNVATGRYLDSDHKGRVYTSPYNGFSFQRWEARHEVKF